MSDGRHLRLLADAPPPPFDEAIEETLARAERRVRFCEAHGAFAVAGREPTRYESCGKCRRSTAGVVSTAATRVAQEARLSGAMRAVMLEVSEGVLEERRRTGADLFDEVWEGVLHIVPPPSAWHQRFGTRLLFVLRPLAEARGLEATFETGVFRPGALLDHRTPDLVFARPDQYSERGVDGRAELVVEILSPDDETYEKLPFYADLGIPEVLVVHPETRMVEVYVNRGGRMEARAPDASGAVRSDVLGVSFSSAEGPKLRTVWSGGDTEI